MVAILEACRERFRPAPMTARASPAARYHWPSRPAQAELRQVQRITVTGGLILSRILALYTTPVVYL